MTTAFKQRRNRIGVLTFGLTALFGLAVLRLIALVVLQGPRLNTMAREEHTAATELAAVRGPIVDRHGEPMALSAETRSIYANPKKVLDANPAERARLAQALEMSAADLDRRLVEPAPFHLAAAPHGSGASRDGGGAQSRRTWRIQRVQTFLSGEQPGRRRWWVRRGWTVRGSPEWNLSTTS